jgi:hypothetical protein
MDQIAQIVKKRKILTKKNIIILSGVLVSIMLFFIARMVLLPDFEPAIRFVSGTEYISGEFGQVIVRLADKDGNPIINADCNATVLYPDKSYFLLDYPLGPSSQPGNYYAEFTTPTITGIYEETVKCAAVSKNKHKEVFISSSFHVSVALNFIVEMSALQAERYRDLVARLNQTSANINDTRKEVLDSIDQTFNQQFMVELQKTEDNIVDEINKTESNLNSSFTEKFSKIYGDFAELGTTMQNIFTG